jgi:hypothetical protein
MEMRRTKTHPAKLEKGLKAEPEKFRDVWML